MERMDPLLFERPDYSFHGGTFTANPVTLSAGLEMLKTLEDGRIIGRLNDEGKRVQKSLEDVFEKARVDAKITRAGSLFHVHFTREEVRDVNAASQAHEKRLANYHLALAEKGVFFLSRKTGAISNAHSKEDLEKLVVETEEYMKSGES
jgi:glutamate-1-semialdehyde 2,1-aminomutase